MFKNENTTKNQLVNSAQKLIIPLPFCRNSQLTIWWNCRHRVVEIRFWVGRKQKSASLFTFLQLFNFPFICWWAHGTGKSGEGWGVAPVTLFIQSGRLLGQHFIEAPQPPLAYIPVWLLVFFLLFLVLAQPMPGKGKCSNFRFFRLSSGSTHRHALTLSFDALLFDTDEADLLG